VLNEFRAGRAPVMIATDVASRGLGKCFCCCVVVVVVGGGGGVVVVCARARVWLFVVCLLLERSSGRRCRCVCARVLTRAHALGPGRVCAQCVRARVCVRCSGVASRVWPTPAGVYARACGPASLLSHRFAQCDDRQLETPAVCTGNRERERVRHSRRRSRFCLFFFTHLLPPNSTQMSRM
jgi:hypothetical protein